jgi:GNAT superfamily N-acetyltransferase
MRVSMKACFRHELRQEDPGRIRDLLHATRFFSSAEIQVAVELARERLAAGGSCSYRFIMADVDARLGGYICYGHIPCTLSSYDIYWIAVYPDFQWAGLGHQLISKAEELIYQSGGRRVYVETSQRPQYDPTRTFYRKMGYRLEAVLEDFYATEDGKAIFCKIL